MDKDQNTDTTDLGTDKPVSANSVGQVMDIQAPKPSSDSSTEDDTVSSAPLLEPDTNSQDTSEEVQTDASPASEQPADEESSDSNFSPAVDASASPVPEDSTAREAPLNDSDATKDISDDETAGAARAATASQASPAVEPAPENPLTITGEPKKKSMPVVPILFAVVIAFALAGLVVFMYMKPNDSSRQSADTTKTSNNQGIAPKPQASPSDVDATNQEIDTTLTTIDETKDFQSADLSDTALGL